MCQPETSELGEDGVQFGSDREGRGVGGYLGTGLVEHLSQKGSLKDPGMC